MYEKEAEESLISYRKESKWAGKVFMRDENTCYKDGFIEGAEFGYNKAKVELEKENAELKKQQFSLRNERNTFLAQNEQYEKDLIDYNESLTKAKEIIRDVYKIAMGDWNDAKWHDKVLREARQFLVEVNYGFLERGHGRNNDCYNWLYCN